MTNQGTSAGGGTLDFAQAFRFVVDDPDWIKKILLGGLFGLLSCILIGLFFVAGYLVRLVQRTARGEARPLPDWDDLGGIFEDGLKAVALYLLYSVAAAAVPLALGCVLFLLGGGASALLTGHGSGSDVAAGAMFFGIIGLYAMIALSVMIVLVFLPAAFVRVALTGRFGAGFEVREIVSFVTRNLVNYALAGLLYLVTSFVAGFGWLLLCVGIFPLAFWSQCVLAWALGETARLDPATS